MEHLAIDLGGTHSQICVRRGDGTIVAETRVATRSLPTWLGEREPSRVIVETCAEAFAVADMAAGFGHEVVVVPATLARQLGVGMRGLKTDQRDARLLSEVSCRMAHLPSVHIPSATARMLKSVCGMRDALVSSRTKLVNTVRGWLRASPTVRIRAGAVETFTRRVREGVADLPAFVERQLRALDSLSVEIKDATRELERIAASLEMCVRMMTTPGVGAVTAVRFVAALDEVTRFKSAHQVASYLGLTPGESSSGERQMRTGITKAGCAELRRVLVQAAWCARRTRVWTYHPMLVWAQQVEARRGKHVAATALARKLAGILYALWRDGTTYDAPRAAALTAEVAA